MPTAVPIQRLVNLLDPDADVLLNVSPAEAAAKVASGDPARVRDIDGQFAIVQKRGHVVRLARSIDALLSREARRWTVSCRGGADRRAVPAPGG